MQLNSIMERFAKEAVQKICSLFRYCSSISPVPAQMCLNGRDDIRKTSSQMGRDLSGTTCIQNQEFQGTWQISISGHSRDWRFSTLFSWYLWSFLFCVPLSQEMLYLSLWVLWMSFHHCLTSNLQALWWVIIQCNFKEEFLLRIQLKGCWLKHLHVMWIIAWTGQ